MSLRPLEDSADALANPARSLRRGPPDRRQNAENVLLVDGVHRHVAEDRVGVAFKRLTPGHRVFAVTPAWTVRFEDLFGRLAKGRHVDPALLGEWIAARRDQRAVARRRLARLGEPHIGEAPEADIAPPPPVLDALYPGARVTTSDLQIEPLTVTVHAGRLERPQPSRRQLSHRAIPSLPTRIPTQMLRR